ncbi:hypothetical protein AAC387_Pa07g3626 [Persea americana]
MYGEQPPKHQSLQTHKRSSIPKVERVLDHASAIWISTQKVEKDEHPGTGQVPQYAPNSSTGDNSAISSSSRALNSEAQAPYYHQCAGINNSRGSKSTSQISQGLKVVEGNSSVGVAFDFNQSITQLYSNG